MALLLSETEIIEFIYRVLRKHGINTSNVEAMSLTLQLHIQFRYGTEDVSKGDQVTTKKRPIYLEETKIQITQVLDLLMTYQTGTISNYSFKLSIFQSLTRD